MTWNAAMAFIFENVIPGRENQALQAYSDAQSYYERLASENRCEVVAYQWIDGGGMMTVRGESINALQEMLETEDGRRFLAEGPSTFEDFTLRMALVGDRTSDVGVIGPPWAASWD